MLPTPIQESLISHLPLHYYHSMYFQYEVCSTHSSGVVVVYFNKKYNRWIARNGPILADT